MQQPSSPFQTLSGYRKKSLILGRGADRVQRYGSLAGRFVLLLVTSTSVFAVLFIFIFILKEAIPFFLVQGLGGVKELFTSTAWFPSREPEEFGLLAIFVGSGLVTLGAVLVAVPLGVAAAVCLSDLFPFWLRQMVKPVIELLTAIPSVVFGFFALAIFAPFLQNQGGKALELGIWLIGLPLLGLSVLVLSDLLTEPLPEKASLPGRWIIGMALAGLAIWGLWTLGGAVRILTISNGTNALNASILLGIMALPTVVSVSEDALQAVGRELREGSYALGATRAETVVKVVIPAARSGIAAAVILGVMRAIGETMVVWMASGNASQIPKPWFNLLEPVRTLTATIAGDMGEAEHVTGAARYHVLFVMASCLLLISFTLDLVSERLIRRSPARRGA